MHTIASLLKLYLRELPEPLLTYELFDEFIAGGRRLCMMLLYSDAHTGGSGYLASPTEGHAMLQATIAKLPIENAVLLKMLWCEYQSRATLCSPPQHIPAGNHGACKDQQDDA